MYLKCDVLLLADVFKKFRKSNLKNHELCPSHYFSAPTLSWDVMLNITKVGLKLISDAGKYSLRKWRWREKDSYISKRCNKVTK